jgi:hypothetical protein
MHKVLMLIGKKGVGKSYIAEFIGAKIADNDGAALITPLAYPIKRACKQIFGLTQHQLYDPNKKEEHIEYWGMSARRIMQLFGTEAMQPTFGKEVWCKILDRRLDELLDPSTPTIYIVDDCRFDHEVKFAIEHWNSFFIEVTSRHRVADVIDRHASELGISSEGRQNFQDVPYFNLDNSNPHGLYFPEELKQKLFSWQSS